MRADGAVLQREKNLDKAIKEAKVKARKEAARKDEVRFLCENSRVSVSVLETKSQ